jgi:hypothetical protein
MQPICGKFNTNSLQSEYSADGWLGANVGSRFVDEPAPRLGPVRIAAMHRHDRRVQMRGAAGGWRKLVALLVCVSRFDWSSQAEKSTSAVTRERVAQGLGEGTDTARADRKVAGTAPK